MKKTQVILTVVFLAIATVLAKTSRPVEGSRLPSSAAEDRLIERLQTLYPDQSEEFLRTRVQNANTDFTRWRAFVRLYWDMFHDREDLQKKLSQWMDIKGLCLGDAHPENFGFLYHPQTGPRFLANDLDDASECPMILDLVRFLAGWRVGSQHIDIHTLITHYQKGLRDEAADLTPLKDLQKDSKKGGMELAKKWRELAESGECVGEFSPLTESEKLQIQEILSQNGRVLAGGCRQVKTSGGSAGQPRLVHWWKVKVVEDGVEKEVFSMAEFKAVGTAAVERFTGDRAELIPRINQAINQIWGEDFARDVYQVVLLDNKVWLIRPRWKGMAEVVLDEVEDPQGVANAEANMLGKIHRVSLVNQGKKKPNPLNEMLNASWVKEADTIVNEVIAQYNSYFISGK